MLQESPSSDSAGAPSPRALRLHSDDNVAVLLSDADPGPIELLGGSEGDGLVASEAIARGHKVALRAIGAGDAVLKCGVAIGFATLGIAAGGWVHTHNCRSGLDERSHTLDPHSGAPTDTRYV